MNKEQRKYLPLTKDRVFKRYFSTNKQVLLSLIKSFLPISDNASDMVILNPEKNNTESESAKQPQSQSDDKLHLEDSVIPPNTPDGKQVVLDLNVKLNSGENVSIEMQVYREKHFLGRMLLYWAQLHTHVVNRGQKYSKISPTYLLAFTDFTVFGDTDEHIDQLEIKSIKHLNKKLKMDLTIMIVELNKFNKSYLELVDMADRWCYIMKHSKDLTPEQVAHLSQDGEIKMALEHLAKVSEEEIDLWDSIAHDRYKLEYNLEREGLIEEGIEQGIEQGRVKEVRNIALNMLQKGLEVSLISEVTGLSAEEIKRLK